MNNTRNGKECLWIILLTLIFLTAIVASATSLEPMSFDTLAQRATMIARMRCTSVRTVWSGGEIWTESRFELLDKAKTDPFGTDQEFISNPATAKTIRSQVARVAPASSAATSIVVRQLGGRLDGIQSHVDGVPQFRPGEEVYLFLWRRAGEPYRVLGWSQGTFRIARDAGTGNPTVTQDSAAALFHADTREFRNSGIRNLALGEFQAKLRQTLTRIAP